jgi:sugar/nucleoside kinase (ribokinase family)
MNILLIGDIMKDYLDTLDVPTSSPIEAQTWTLGGTLKNMIDASCGIFTKTYFIGAINKSDEEIVDKELNEKPGRYSLIQKSNTDITGVCVRIYANDVRVKMISIRGVNQKIKFRYRYKSIIKKVDYIYLNGWAFSMETETTKTCLRIIRIAKNHGKKIIFDFLPHGIKKLNKSYLEVIKMADILISEIDTFKLHFDYNKEVDNYAAMHNKEMVILFDWVNKIYVYNKDGLVYDCPTLYSKESSKHYLDELALKKIVEFGTDPYKIRLPKQTGY